MLPQTRILCIHGVGGKDASIRTWSLEWKNAIGNLATGNTKFCFLKIDDLFEESRQQLGGIRYIKAVHAFLSSWVHVEPDDRYSQPEFANLLRWYAGMPAQYVTDKSLRAALRRRLSYAMNLFRPDVVFAHSLGTVLAYDGFRLPGFHAGWKPPILITAGCQLGHPALHGLAGTLFTPPSIMLWINLHNSHDKLFASRPMETAPGRFLEVETTFQKGLLNHDALSYILHPAAICNAWSLLHDTHSTIANRNRW